MNSPRKISKTSEDLLLQQSIQTNQQLEQIQQNLISIQNLKSTLPTSIQNVVNQQLQKLLDENKNQMDQNKNDYEKEVAQFHKDIAGQVEKLETQTKTYLESECNSIVSTTKNEMLKAVGQSTKNLDLITKIIKKTLVRNLLGTFLCAIIVVISSICFLTYFQNYKDGTAIAEAKAVEALNSERERIGREAINSYKASNQFTEDSCKSVAENIGTLEYMYFLNSYIPSKQKEKYPAVKKFCNEYLVFGASQYREKKKAK